MPKIYTKTGDSGESSIKNERLRKDALVFDVLGDLDELNSWLGFIRAEVVPQTSRSADLEVRAPISRFRGTVSFLESIQQALMALSADVAGYGPFTTDLVPRLESEIDRLSPAEDFSLCLPFGGIHVARAVCRRAERHLVAFNPAHAGLPFVNRLSDYLYALAESPRKDVQS